VALAQAQVPTIIASSVICLAAGIAIGAGGIWYWKFDPKENAFTGNPDPDPGGMMGKGGGEGKGGPPGGGKGGPPGGMGGAKGGLPPGGGKGGGPGGGFGIGSRPTSKGQLASLVAKLDQLTKKPLEVKLTDEQRAKIAKQLEGLDAADGVSEEEAKKRLDAILATIEGDKETLEAAGFRWPGDNPPRTPSGDNPFAEGEAKEHLKQLLERVGKAKQ
jgi:hypothetical protein